MSFMKKIGKSIKIGADLEKMDQKSREEAKKLEKLQKEKAIEDERLRVEREAREYLALSPDERAKVDEERRAKDLERREQMLSEAHPAAVRVGRAIAVLAPKVRTGIQKGKETIAEIQELQKKLPKEPPTRTPRTKDVVKPVSPMSQMGLMTQTMSPSGPSTPDFFDFGDFSLYPRKEPTKAREKPGVYDDMRIETPRKPKIADMTYGFGPKTIDSLFDYGDLSPVRKPKKQNRKF